MYVESAISKGVPLAYLTIDLVQRLYFLLSRAWRWTSSMNYIFFSILGLGGTALYFRVNLNLYTGNARDSVRKKEFLVHSFNIGGDQIDKLIKFFDNGFNEKKKTPLAVCPSLTNVPKWNSTDESEWSERLLRALSKFCFFMTRRKAGRTRDTDCSPCPWNCFFGCATHRENLKRKRSKWSIRCCSEKWNYLVCLNKR